MVQELVYTSAPQGLKPGSRGFCTVATSSGLTRNLAERLESLSGYKHVFGASDANAELNPVAYSHLCIGIGGKVLHVLSRVADAGLDYTQRSNKLAHHLVLGEEELVADGPSWLLEQPGVLMSRWEGEPRTLAPRGGLPAGRASQGGPCQAWQRYGDAGWAGILAATAVELPQRQAVIIFAPGAQVVPLIGDALRLLPPALRWKVSFSTYFTKLPPGIDCQWRCVLDGTDEAKAARVDRNALVLDLTRPLPAPQESAWTQYARSGVQPKSLSAAIDLRAAGTPSAAPLRAATARAIALPIARTTAESIGVSPEFDDALDGADESRWSKPWMFLGAGALVLMLLGLVAFDVLGVSAAKRPAALAKGDAVALPAPNTAAAQLKILALEHARNVWEEMRPRIGHFDNEIHTIESFLPSLSSDETAGGDRPKGQTDLGHMQKKLKDVEHHSGRVEEMLAGIKTLERDFERLQADPLKNLNYPQALNAGAGLAAMELESDDEYRRILRLADDELHEKHDRLEVLNKGLASATKSLKRRIARAKSDEKTRLHAGDTKGKIRPDAPLDLVKEVDLQLPSTFSSKPGAVSLGHVYVNDDTACQLKLLGGDIDAGRAFRITDGPGVTGERHWKLMLHTAKTGLFREQDEVKAELILRGQELTFQWVPRAGTDLEQIKNCVLEASVGQHVAHVAFRKPIHNEISQDFRAAELQKQEIVIPYFPRHQAIRLQVDIVGVDETPIVQHFIIGKPSARMADRFPKVDAVPFDQPAAFDLKIWPPGDSPPPSGSSAKFPEVLREIGLHAKLQIKTGADSKADYKLMVLKLGGHCKFQQPESKLIVDAERQWNAETKELDSDNAHLLKQIEQQESKLDKLRIWFVRLRDAEAVIIEAEEVGDEKEVLAARSKRDTVLRGIQLENERRSLRSQKPLESDLEDHEQELKDLANSRKRNQRAIQSRREWLELTKAISAKIALDITLFAEDATGKDECLVQFSARPKPTEEKPQP
ncbi:MAG TPA: hypothetical protein VHY91_11755 [Pirellulales bacterium]|jgi:hypothetical protein|nr:hypothetical protein [Pirellulales bacterium]